MQFNPRAAETIIPEVVSMSDLARMIFEAVQELQQDVSTLEKRAREFAYADREYRREKSKAYLMAKGTIPEREAAVAKETEELRFKAHLAEGLKEASLEAVRSRRAKLSALQTLANAVKAEIEMNTYVAEPA